MSALDALPLLPVLDEAFWQDPHAAVRSARAAAPVARTPWGSIVLLDHADALAALGDPRLVNDYDVLLTRHGITDGPLWSWWKLAMLNNNPPVHTRLRSLVSRAFTPRAVASAAEVVRHETRRLLSPAVERGSIELVTALCEPLPIAVLCRLVGVPRDETPWIDAWIAELGLMFSESMTPEIRARAEAAMVGLGEYVEGLAATRAREPGDDLLTTLVQAQEDGDRLSRDELVAMVINLLFGALDTTRGALSMGVGILAAHPDLQAALRADPALVAPAVEELLRVEPPVGEISRIAATPVTLHDIALDEGAVVGISVLGANRDPAVHERPDDVVLDRFTRAAAPASLSFGRGIHHCIGSALARVELREAIGVLLEDTSTFAIDGDAPRYVPFLRVRSLEALSLALRPPSIATREG